MKDNDEFIQQLRDYVQGEDTPGAHEIEEWALGNGLGGDKQQDDFISVAMPGFPNNKTPAIKIDRKNVDYSGFSYKEAVHKEAEWIIREGTGKEREIATLLSHDGNTVLGSWEGGTSRTNIPPKDFFNAIKGADDGSVDIMHCHLKGALPADVDMVTMCDNKAIDKMTIIFPNKEVWALSVGGGKRPPKNDIQMQWSGAYRRLENEKKAELNVNELTDEQKIGIVKSVFDIMLDSFHWKWEKV
ncbi:MAG: hypothetical protein LBB89_12335 [Treponema sp.]|jgi:hypothetical protein|nr:hypothetical protein [Treponema sp.]